MTLPGPLTLPQVFPLLQRHYLEVLSEERQAWTLSAHNARYVFSSEHEGVFLIRGQWHGSTADNELFARLRLVITECNSRYAFPKAYLWPLPESGRYGLAAEGCLLTNHAPTEEQFYYFLDTVLTAAAQFFRDADRKLPELVTWDGAA